MGERSGLELGLEEGEGGEGGEGGEEERGRDVPNKEPNSKTSNE